jgi:hypothetical protein
VVTIGVRICQCHGDITKTEIQRLTICHYESCHKLQGHDHDGRLQRRFLQLQKGQTFSSEPLALHSATGLRKCPDIWQGRHVQ